MYHISYILVVGVGVNSSHNSLLNTKGSVEGLGQRCKAVGRTACIRYTLDLTGQLLIVDAQNDSRIDIILCRNTQHDLTGAGLEMVGITALRRFSRAENTRRFHNNLHAHILPGQFSRIPDSQNLNRFAVDD
ncbi:hypothetical protein ES703_77842 [subsurface metagenome]